MATHFCTAACRKNGCCVLSTIRYEGPPPRNWDPNRERSEIAELRERVKELERKLARKSNSKEKKP